MYVKSKVLFVSVLIRFTVSAVFCAVLRGMWAFFIDVHETGSWEKGGMFTLESLHSL